MSESPALPLLFTQLQARYPTSGLLTELVQMDADRYVVRALVQLGSLTLATSLATAATVEQAEDQARLRVLALLGIHATLSSVPAGSFSSYGTPAQPHTALQDTMQFVDVNNATLQKTIPTASPLPDMAAIAPPPPFPTFTFEPTATIATTLAAPIEPYTTALTEPEPETFDAPPDLDDALYNEATYAEEPFETPAPIIEAASNGEYPDADITADKAPTAKSKPRKPGVDKPPVSAIDPPDSASNDSPSRDLSSLISQIGVEIDRIGWSKRQGSTYLQKTYGKKTRSELTDDELEDFLTYLNTQPSATVAS